MELMIDFSVVLPENLSPNYNQVVTLLNQTVANWPKGSAVLTRGRKGVFNIKIWDSEKGKKLVNQKLQYYYEGDKSQKFVTVKIVEKPKFLRFQNPKYVTLVGFESFPASLISNAELDGFLGNFGTIINPTEDVFAMGEIFTTGKRKLRIDLDKGKDIPRDLHVEFTSAHNGEKYKARLRSFYKGQPYHCQKCNDIHHGDCPEWLRKKQEKEKVQQIKEKETKCAIIGASNVRHFNENGLMATVTAVSGAKIGHIANQLSFEKLDNMKNVIIFAGLNSIEDTATEKDSWEKKVNREVKELETQVQKLCVEGKNVFIMSIPPVEKATSSDINKKCRKFINDGLSGMCARVMKKGPGTAAFRQDNDANYNKATDFEDDQHLSRFAIERIIGEFDELLPVGQKLKSKLFTDRPTCEKYQGCYATYPIGCPNCTLLNHSEEDCKVKKSEKRNLSSSSDEHDADVNAKKNKVV